MKTRKFLSFVLIMILLLSVGVYCLADQKEVPTCSFSGGNGTEEDPYLMSTAEDLWALSEITNYYYSVDKHYRYAFYKLTADIDLGERNWLPISGHLPFEGCFDGDGHSISSLMMNYNDDNNEQKMSYFGLFSEVVNGCIKNLTITDSEISISTKSGDCGAIVGWCLGTVYNCTTTETVTIDSSSSAGGICGYVSISKSFIPSGFRGINGCKNYASVKAEEYAAGISYKIDCDVADCENYGNVTAQHYAGGIACFIEYGNAENLKNYGDISSEEAGGICAKFSSYGMGDTDSDVNASMIACENHGNVCSTQESCEAGGICASLKSGKIKSCVNTGAISSMGYAGGIVGEFRFYSIDSDSVFKGVSDCANSGTISGKRDCGGIIGYSYALENIGLDTDKIFISDCENSGIVNSEDYAGGIIGTYITWTDTHTLVMENLKNTAEIMGHGGTGGICGRVTIQNKDEELFYLVQFVNCENSGDVCDTALDGDCAAGGIAGYVYALGMTKISAEQENCVNTGVLTTPKAKSEIHCGDFIGVLEKDGNDKRSD